MHILAGAHRGLQTEGSPIFALPVEVISLVFTSPVPPSGSQGPSERLNHFNLRLVCRFWREIADCTPQLWTRIALRRWRLEPDQLRTLLGRSRGRPLDLRVHVQSLAGTKGLLPLLLPAIARTRTLSLSCMPCNMHSDLSARSDWPELYERAMSIIGQLLETDAPLLEALTIHALNLPRDVLSGVTPQKLRSVELIDCGHAAPTSAFFGSPLTHLVIDFCTSWATIEDMLSTLAALPQLEHFQWDIDAYPTSPRFMNPAAYKSHSVPLHRLQYLNLYMDLEHVVPLIPILDFPSTATLVISGELMREPASDMPFFVDLLDSMESSFEPHLRRAFPSSDQGFQRISILPHREENPEGFNAVMETPAADQGAPPTKFEFGACWDMECQDEYMLMLQEVFSWPGIGSTAVHLNVDHAVLLRSELHWRLLLEMLSSIKFINVRGPAAAFLFHALQTASGRLARGLEGITVNNVDVKVLEILFQALDKRAEQSLPPLELCVHRCQVGSSVLKQLECHPGVKKVEWDGQCHGLLVYGEHDGDKAVEDG